MLHTVPISKTSMSLVKQVCLQYTRWFLKAPFENPIICNQKGINKEKNVLLNRIVITLNYMFYDNKYSVVTVTELLYKICAVSKM